MSGQNIVLGVCRRRVSLPLAGASLCLAGDDIDVATQSSWSWRPERSVLVGDYGDADTGCWQPRSFMSGSK